MQQPGTEKSEEMHPFEEQQNLRDTHTRSNRKPGPAVLSCFKKHAVLWCTVEIVLIAVVCVGAGVAIAFASGKKNAEGPAAVSWCPDGWFGSQGKSYYFSKVEGDWTESRNNCSSLNASLAWIESPEVLKSQLPYPGRLDHWIGLRKDEAHVWRWVNGTEFNRQFEIRGGADCASLDEDIKVSSSSCSSRRKWICSKLHTC